MAIEHIEGEINKLCLIRCLEKMNGKLGAKARLTTEGGFSERLQNSSYEEEGSQQNNTGHSGGERHQSACSSENQSTAQRRTLRSHYRNLKNSIAEERQEIVKAESDKFESLISKVQNLHSLVHRPREQVADAEALLDITTAFLASVKSSQNSDGESPSDFINAILRNFSDQAHRSMEEDNDQTHISWESLGYEASAIFCDAAGASTMLGPMDNEPKQRKVVSSRRRGKPTESTRPEAVADSGGERKTETDKNMATMFNILRKHKCARLEALVLNRQSFSQTVENIFTLSFLVKDGRVEISLDENRNHFVAPRNAPSSHELASGKVSYNQFVFRFDFKDWKLMMEAVDSGHELMPHRTSLPPYSSSENASATPIRKLSRNRGHEAPSALGVQDENESVEEDFIQRRVTKRRSKRILQ